MARQRGSLIKLQGTIAGLTFVDSKTYGSHTRAARGTHKEAKVNGVLRDNAENAKPVTSLASPVLKQLKELEKGFAPGDLWSRMTGCMFKAKSMLVNDLLESIKGLEVNERHAFSKLFAKCPQLKVSLEKKVLNIEVEFYSHARFSKDVKASEYLYAVTVLFFDGKGGCMKDVMETEWISFGETLSIYEMEFLVPKGVKYFLIVNGVRGGRDERVVESFAASGYRVCDWGKC